jgi:hypothetical protein
METNDLKKETEGMYGRLLAVQAGLTAVVMSLPQNPVLPLRLQHEIERVRAILLGHSISDYGLSAFEDQIRVIQKAVELSHPPIGK